MILFSPRLGVQRVSIYRIKFRESVLTLVDFAGVLLPPYINTAYGTQRDVGGDDLTRNLFRQVVEKEGFTV